MKLGNKAVIDRARTCFLYGEETVLGEFLFLLRVKRARDFCKRGATSLCMLLTLNVATNTIFLLCNNNQMNVRDRFVLGF